MKNEPLVVERTYNAPAAKVWQALTQPEKMKQWYFDIPGFKAEPGFEFTFTGESEDKAVSFKHLCIVKEVIPMRKLTHTWRYENMPGDSTVTWELFPEGNSTRVVLTHAGLDTFRTDHPSFRRESYSNGWNAIMGTHLTEFLEKDRNSAPITGG